MTAFRFASPHSLIKRNIMSSSQPPKKDESAQAGPSTTAAATDKAAAEAGKKKLPQLGALEDDDEFEVSARGSAACLPWHGSCKVASTDSTGVECRP